MPRSKSSRVLYIGASAASRLAAQREHQAQQLYIVDFARAPGGDEAARLCGILQAREAPAPADGCMAIPLRGQTSAWATRAMEVLRLCGLGCVGSIERGLWSDAGQLGHDPLLEEILPADEFAAWLAADDSASDACVDSAPPDDTATALAQLGLELDAGQLDMLARIHDELGRRLTPAELLLVTVSSGEHCRHLTFNAVWPELDDSETLLACLRATNERARRPALVAYTDNAAAVQTLSVTHAVLKSETHNHPTGISPFSGAATGVGGEIRDEAATGRGARSLAGCSGYMLADIALPLDADALDANAGDPVATPARILLDAPLGAASYGNEFGRPTLTGFCRFYERTVGEQRLGFAKPVMLAAGIGAIEPDSLAKLAAQAGDLIVQLGAPGMRVGVAGGAAASGQGARHAAQLSVQRADATMQRSIQEVIDRCWQDDANPLRSIHDVGAGGLGTAIAELTRPHGCRVDLAAIPLGQPAMTAAEILCNETQERYVALVASADYDRLEQLCQRERCPLAVIGQVTDSGRMEVAAATTCCVDLPYRLILGLAPATATAQLPEPQRRQAVEPDGADLPGICRAVLRQPSVGDKSHLVTINDRTVGGLTARDQLVGPWQLAVADCAVVASDHQSASGQALACGERPAVGAIDPTAGARIAIAEALTNLAAAQVGPLENVSLSLNWLGNRETDTDRGELVAAVRAAARLARELGIGVVGGKDSLSMRTRWPAAAGVAATVSAPTTCVATATAPVARADLTLTPCLRGGQTLLMHLPVSGRRDLAGSAYAACLELPGTDVADVEAGQLASWWAFIAAMHEAGLMLAYHDVSDGGLFATACEMAFAADCGLALTLDSLCMPAHGMDADGCEISADNSAPGAQARLARALFCETPGAVFEVAQQDAPAALAIAASHGVDKRLLTLGRPTAERSIKIILNAQPVVDEPLDRLRGCWSEFASQVRRLRDGVDADLLAAPGDAGVAGLYATPHVPARKAHKTRLAAIVLRDQGTNGYREMAAALELAGFAPAIVAITDVVAGRRDLQTDLLALPGGFSHGDVLGAGRASALTILHNPRLREQFAAVFASSALVLGVCNGCQTLARLGELLPRPCALPSFAPNSSGRFEGRLVQVEVLPSPSPFLAPLAGLRLPVPLACLHGRAERPDSETMPAASAALRYIEPGGLATSRYPANPCGTPAGECGFVTPDGKVTLLMPHPERAVRPLQLSWCPPSWRDGTAWRDFFVHARNHLG